jgi:hypothetical protein
MIEKGIGPKRESLIVLWIWTICWCSASALLAFVLWIQPIWGWWRLFPIPFLVIALVSLSYTKRRQRKYQMTQGLRLLLSDWQPRTGKKLQAELFLPADYKMTDWLQHSLLSMHLVQYDEESVGRSTTTILLRRRSIKQSVRPEQLQDGSWWMVSSFDIPANAPASGSPIHRNTVVWQLELHETKEADLAVFPVQIRAALQPTLKTPALRPAHQAC